MAAVICALTVPLLVSEASAGAEKLCVKGDTEGILGLGGRIRQTHTPKRARGVSAEYDSSHDVKIIDAIENLETEIPVVGMGITKDNVTGIINRIWNTNPQLFYLEKWEYSYYPSTGEVKELLFTYTGSREEIVQQRAEIRETLDEAADAVDAQRMTEEEIALAMHDYLASHTKYAYDDYLEDTVDSSAYNIYGALVEGEAVCQGYALAYEYLLRQYGISCGIASSDAANHAWNVVEIRDKWYHVDVTWDDPPYDNLGQALHGAFLLSTDGVLALEPLREDYVTITADGCTCEEAADTSFEEGFWIDSNASMYYYGGCWYYADRGEFAIVKYEYAAQKKEILVRIDERWPDWEDPSCWMAENFSRIARIKETLYYSTPTCIYALPLEGEEAAQVFAVDTSDGYICGLGVMDGKLAYVLKTEDTWEEAEEVLTVKLSGGVPAVPEEPETSRTDPVVGSTGQTVPVETKTGEENSAANAAEKKASIARQTIRRLESRKRRCLTVVWKKNVFADGYQIFCSTSKKFVRSKTRIIRIRNNKKQKYTIKKLKSKKRYYVRVRAYKKVGSVCYYGSYSKRKAIKVK